MMRVKAGLTWTIFCLLSVTSTPSWVASNTAAAWRRLCSLARCRLTSLAVPIKRSARPWASSCNCPRDWIQR
ncbi:hypothetical protein D9M68_708420 [compost metagenome]